MRLSNDATHERRVSSILSWLTRMQHIGRVGTVSCFHKFLKKIERVYTVDKAHSYIKFQFVLPLSIQTTFIINRIMLAAWSYTWSMTMYSMIAAWQCIYRMIITWLCTAWSYTCTMTMYSMILYMYQAHVQYDCSMTMYSMIVAWPCTVWL